MKKKIKKMCPDCGVTSVKADIGYCRPSRLGESGVWVIHCLNCHINDICEIQSTHGGRVVAEARAAKEAATGA